MTFEEKFEQKYSELNDAQKRAVDHIDGPVMVLAGPGTGKTTLLSMRAANILRETDTNPENILCLTFTDAASQNMTDKVAEIIGPAGFDVAVHTFHSFSAMTMGRYSDYFYRGANFTAADEISKLEILNDILRELPHDNPLSGTHDEQATYLSAVKSAISHIKRQGGYTPDDLRQLMKQDLKFIEFAEPIFAETFSDKISKGDLLKYTAGHERMAGFDDQTSSLATEIINDFADAINEATASGKTNTVTAYKNRYFNARAGKMNDRAKTEKTLAICDVYENYQDELAKRKLYDFDDMIVNMVEQIENSADFRAELQEQFQYIMVDEFQDTNEAQMRILSALADAPDSNIMVVGDDDQAIYSFQGANINNMRDFMHNYPKAEVVQLFENYRSEGKILALAENIIDGVDVRIKKDFFEKVTALLARKKPLADEKIEFISAANGIDECAYIAEQVAAELKREDGEIAVIAREHRDLMELVPFLRRAGVHNITYERSQNALGSAPVQALETLARIVVYIADGAHRRANELLPELLAHDAWNIKARDIWKLSLEVENRNNWLEEMLKRAEFSELADWLIDMSKKIKNISMENALDELFDKSYKNHYFSDAALAENPTGYLEYLSDLIAIRDQLREHDTDNPTLKNFVQILDLYRKYDQPIITTREFGQKSRVHLMTAHRAKGLEFDSVFVMRATKERWLRNSSDHFFPSNLRITNDSDANENLRLLFVAATRAKHRLIISAPKKVSAKGESLNILSYLGDIATREINTDSTSPDNLETAWNAKLTVINDDLKSVLAPTLRDYKLNATALNSFVNLEYAGPEKFLLNNLLHFPTAKSANASYGTAVHETLKFAHGYFNKNGQKPDEKMIKANFRENLKNMHLDKKDETFYRQKGEDKLPKYIASADFNDKQSVEQVFNARIGQMNLTGKMDLIEVDEKTKTIAVYDYKTGNSFERFNSGKTKTHTYYQQLMFYKLLIENSNNRPNYKVTRGVLHFVDSSSEPTSLEINYTDADMKKFVQLLESVWQRIMTLDFPNVSDYSKNLKGTLAFEDFLLDF
ncbi:MAG: ATP-dependent helicase [Candidatus Nomurabacteria bacterium]|jgi:DNA helicase-2/ATP-dependent DNA helicase PcrA|nr:ATP-dependent helicase [Candidatus Nomurabacteria bacterium]